jgi:hypothetical protein
MLAWSDPNGVFNYDKRLGSSEWHQLFSVDDPRRTLTWRNRFANLPGGIKYYNFYSTGEEVLATYAGELPDIHFPDFWNSELGRNSWVLQEKRKGRNLPLGSTNVMGWGFNQNNYQTTEILDDGLTDTHIWPPAIANSQIRNEQLLSVPFFLMRSAGQLGNRIFESTVGAAEVNGVRDELLSLALPSLSLVTGGWKGGDVVINGFIKEDRKIDMNDPLKRNGWPYVRENDGDLDWKHSDIKDVAYSFTYRIFDIIKN